MSTEKLVPETTTRCKEELARLEDVLWEAPLADTLEARVLLHKVLPRIVDITRGDIESLYATQIGVSVSCSWSDVYRGCRGDTHTESYDIPWAVLLSEDSMGDWKEAAEEARRKADEEKRQKEREQRERAARETRERQDCERLKAKYG